MSPRVVFLIISGVLNIALMAYVCWLMDRLDRERRRECKDCWMVGTVKAQSRQLDNAWAKVEELEQGRVR
jgi:hypothetical protein